jgi:threonine synthase
MVRYAAEREGMLLALEAAATIAAYHTLIARHVLKADEETVLFFTGSGLADMERYTS